MGLELSNDLPHLWCIKQLMGTLFCAEELWKGARKHGSGQSSLGRCSHPGLELQEAPGSSPWARAGEGGVLACRGCACGSELALLTGEGRQNEWCQRIEKDQQDLQHDPAETKAQVIHCTREIEAVIFSSLPSITNITETFLAALNVPDWIYFYQSFNFPNQIPGCLDNLCPGHLAYTLCRLPLSRTFLFIIQASWCFFPGFFFLGMN